MSLFAPRLFAVVIEMQNEKKKSKSILAAVPSESFPSRFSNLANGAVVSDPLVTTSQAKVYYTPLQSGDTSTPPTRPLIQRPASPLAPYST